MSDDMVFSPQAWQSGSDAMAKAAEQWRGRIAPIIEAIGKPIEGADQGATAVDLAVSVLCEPVAGLVAEMADGIVESLQATAHNMGETAKAYREVEDGNVDLIRQIPI
ncbi:MAG: hypothetical protein Q4G45_00630 [Actinomycetia bacterium]|nr:hypothetical protein [Actinomycetes bacterium]